MENEVIDYTSQSNSVMSPNQLQHFRVAVDNSPVCYEIDGHAGCQRLKADNLEVSCEHERGLILLKTWKHSIKELEECPIIMLSSDAPWDPINETYWQRQRGGRFATK